MLVNSVFGLLVPIAARMGLWWLLAVRFIQGLGEVSTVRSMASLGARKDADPVTRKLVFALLPKFSCFCVKKCMGRTKQQPFPQQHRI